MAARLPDWETRFAAYLADAHDKVRAGRKHYCGLFAGGAVEAVTGDNVVAQFRGRLGEVAKALEATLDGLFDERPAALAQRGDLAWHDGSVGVVIGAEALFVGETAGVPDLVRVHRRDWVKAWAVGNG